jgi:nitrate reductase assembly molybdenum cofactor insertion protein NarJ
MTELKLTGMYRTGSPLHKGINEIINVGKKTALEELQEKYKSIFDRYVPPSIARKDED